MFVGKIGLYDDYFIYSRKEKRKILTVDYTDTNKINRLNLIVLPFLNGRIISACPKKPPGCHREERFVRRSNLQ